MLRVKRCSACKDIKEIESFNKDTSQKDSLSSRCKECESTRSKVYRESEHGKAKNKAWAQSEAGKASNKISSAKYRAALFNAIPKWQTIEEEQVIALFYINCPKGCQVDHIIPLQGEKVSGLHVIENLQYLTKEENQRKGNKFDLELQR